MHDGAQDPHHQQGIKRVILNRFMRLLAPILLLSLLPPAAVAAETQAPISKEAVELFEKDIRPVLAQYCYECHSTQARKIKGKLLLDSRGGIAKGGENGAILVPGDPVASRLIAAIRWSDPDLQMPPKKKLSAQQIEKFEQWIRLGAPDPRDDASTANKLVAPNIEAGRKWWAFQPLAESPAPLIKQ